MSGGACFWRGRAAVGLGRGPGLCGGVGDSCGVIGVDGGEGAELEAADVSENGGAASGDAIGGQEPVKVVERVVDALGGLKTLATVGESRVDVSVLLLHELRVVFGAKS